MVANNSIREYTYFSLIKSMTQNEEHKQLLMNITTTARQG